MSVSPTAFEGTALTLMWLGSLALACASVSLILLLLLRHVLKERAWNKRQQRKEELRQLIHTSLQTPEWATADKPRQLGDDDFSIVLELAVEWLRPLSGQQAKAIISLLRAWGSEACLQQILLSGSLAQKTEALIFCSHETTEATRDHLVKHCSDQDLNIQMICLRGLALRGEIDALWSALNLINLKEMKSILLLADIFVKLEQAGVPFLLSLMNRKDASVEIRVAAVIALGLIKDPQSVEPLLSLLSKKALDINLRAQALLALGRIGDPRAEKAILAGLSHQDFAVRVNAVHAAAQIKSVGFIQKLSKLLDDPVWFVRFRAAEALTKIEGAGLVVLNKHCEEVGGVSCSVLAEHRGKIL